MPSPQTKNPQGHKIHFCDHEDAAESISRQDLSPEKLQAIRRLHKLDKRWNAVIEKGD